MFDGVKICYYDLCLVKMLHADLKLVFIEHTNLKTRDIKGHSSEYKGLKFKTFPSGRIVITGSLHKYFNGGLHNHDSYTVDNLRETLIMLESEFSIEPNRALIQNLEFGVNLIVPFNPKGFIDSLISYKFKSFNTMAIINPGYGKEYFQQQYGVKIYNKGLQYGRGEYILRIEKKVLAMCALNFGKLYLSDLTNPDLWKHCKKQLVQMLDDIIINEPIPENQLAKNEKRIYNSIINESKRANFNRDQRKRYKKGFNSIISKYGTSHYKPILVDLINEKCNELAQLKVHTF